MQVVHDEPRRVRMLHFIESRLGKVRRSETLCSPYAEVAW